MKRALAGLLPLLFSGCVVFRELYGDFTYSKRHVWRPTVSITLPASMAVTNVLDTTLFNGLHPGLTFEDAERLYGKPQSILYEQDAYTPCLAIKHCFYRTPKALVSVAREEHPVQMSSNRSTTWWTVFAYPPSTGTCFRFEEVFDRAVLDLLQGLSPDNLDTNLAYPSDTSSHARPDGAGNRSGLARVAACDKEYVIHVMAGVHGGADSNRVLCDVTPMGIRRVRWIRR